MFNIVRMLKIELIQTKCAAYYHLLRLFQDLLPEFRKILCV